MNDLEIDINDIDETLDFVFEKLNKIKWKNILRVILLK